MHVWGEALVLDSFTLQVGGDFGEQEPHIVSLSCPALEHGAPFWQNMMHQGIIELCVCMLIMGLPLLLF